MKKQLNTISKIMGTLVQPQLCTFSYRMALFWPQKQTWHLSNLLLQWDSQNCQCYPRKTCKSRHFWHIYRSPHFHHWNHHYYFWNFKPQYDHTIRWLQYNSNCNLFSKAGNTVTPKNANLNPDKVEERVIVRNNLRFFKSIGLRHWGEITAPVLVHFPQ